MFAKAFISKISLMIELFLIDECDFLLFMQWIIFIDFVCGIHKTKQNKSIQLFELRKPWFLVWPSSRSKRTFESFQSIIMYVYSTNLHQQTTMTPQHQQQQTSFTFGQTSSIYLINNKERGCHHNIMTPPSTTTITQMLIRTWWWQRRRRRRIEELAMQIQKLSCYAWMGWIRYGGLRTFAVKLSEFSLSFLFSFCFLCVLCVCLIFYAL